VETERWGHVRRLFEVAVDLGLGLDLGAAQLAVLAAGLHQHRRPRVAFEVAHLLRLGVGPDPDLALARHEPERHRVRPSPRPVGGDDRDPLLREQLEQLPLAQPDLVAPAHGEDSTACEALLQPHRAGLLAAGDRDDEVGAQAAALAGDPLFMT